MSHYWGYRCEPCKSDSPVSFNHGENILRTLYKNRDLIRQVEALGWPVAVGFEICDGEETFAFLARHEGEGHLIVLVDEYNKTEPMEGS